MKNRGRNGFWTIDELAARVAERLASGYGGVASGRVRDVPDLRTIRYYTTLGLLDRPVEMRGRTALYGERHLLQLVAIKRLQSEGRSLAEIQRGLIGQPDRVLRRLAGGDAGVGGSVQTHSPSRRKAERDETFWRTRPEAPRDETPGVSTEIALGNAISLSLETTRPLDDADLAMIRMAAAPMIELLKLRGLLGPADDPPKRGEYE